MKLYPAMDLRNGKCVRLMQGDFGQETVYGNDPMDMAKSFVAKGAERLHLVNLDGALDGDWSPEFKETLSRLVTLGIPIQVGGGIRNQCMARWLLESGVDTCVFGTAAVERPEWVVELAHVYGKRIAVGVDVKEGMVATRGWMTKSLRSWEQFVESMEWMGIKKLVLTEISRDGSMVGPDLGALGRARGLFGGELIASGGVGSLKDLVGLKGIGVEGVIVGKAIYENAFTIDEAKRVCLSGELRIIDGGLEDARGGL